MTDEATGEAVVTGVVALPAEQAFVMFTDEIDRWWQRRRGDDPAAIIRFEGERLVAVTAAGAEVLATVATWSPPDRLDLDWLGPHGLPGDRVAIEFEPHGGGSRVTIRHQRGGLSPAAVESAIIGLWWGDVVARLARAPH